MKLNCLSKNQLPRACMLLCVACVLPILLASCVSSSGSEFVINTPHSGIITPSVTQTVRPEVSTAMATPPPVGTETVEDPPDQSNSYKWLHTATPTLPPPTVTLTPDYTPTPDIRPDPRTWRIWPVIPTVSARAIEIYQQGLASGSNPQTFSIIGDCQSEPPVFFGIYSSNWYVLREEEAHLQETIDYFKDDFDRLHATVKNGLSVASVFTPLWAPKEICEQNESPLDCEFRLHRPSIVFINLGTNWKNGNGYTHAIRLREVLDFVIAHGALPILSTKGDNQEGDHSINLSTAELAYEYDIPLWNYWAAIQYLPDHGLDTDREDSNYLSVDAWDERSYTGLRVLDRVWRVVNGMTIP